MFRFDAQTRHLLAIAALALCLPAAQASTAAYDQMLSSGFTEEGIFPRIVIRDDIGLTGSASFAANPAFSGVVAVGSCTGVLIAPTTMLSARHCSPSLGGTVRFGTNLSSPTFSTSIQSVLFPGGGTPGSSLLNGGDIAILTLSSVVPISIATPFVLTDATTELTGFSVVTIGYGDRGIGSTGATGFDGIRRGGTNVLDRYGAAVNTSSTLAGTANIFSADFDNPTGTSNTLGWLGSQSTATAFEATTAGGDSGGTNVLDRYGAAVNTSSTLAGTANIFSADFDNPTGTSNTLGWLGSQSTATAFEATTAGGDSGGPLLFDNGGQWTVMGVLSSGTTSNSVYGDISWWTGVAPFRSQIESFGGVFVAVVPEPGTYGLMLLGLGLFYFRMRSLAAA